VITNILQCVRYNIAFSQLSQIIFNNIVQPGVGLLYYKMLKLKANLSLNVPEGCEGRASSVGAERPGATDGLK
jgi:hypothetical protein